MNFTSWFRKATPAHRAAVSLMDTPEEDWGEWSKWEDSGCGTQTRAREIMMANGSKNFHGQSRDKPPVHRADAETSTHATTDRAGLPEGKKAFGFRVYKEEHLPVVRNKTFPVAVKWDTLDAEAGVVDVVWAYSFTVWQSGIPWTENYSQRDWDRLVEKGEAYEI